MGAMTVVVQTNNMGEIVRVFSDLPIKIIKVDRGGSGGTIPVAGPLAAVPAVLRKAVARIDDKWGHLTHVQRDRIVAVAVDELVATTAEAGLRRSLLSGFAENMDVDDLLEQIADDEDEGLVEKLGFDPETGRDLHPEDAADDKCKYPYAWAPIEGIDPQHWHLLHGEQPRNPPAAKILAAYSACGAGFNYEADKKRHSGRAFDPPGVVCPMCRAAFTESVAESEEH